MSAGDAGTPDPERAGLERRFRTAVSSVRVGPHTFALLHPANPEELISESEFEEDERLPYWADIWPSSTILADRVGAMAGRGRTLLELGCGAGLVSAAAARAGFAVTATDYNDDALRFTAVNARANAGVDVETRLVDWRRFPADLGRFDVVVASDVLYERPYAPLLAHAFAATLAPGGFGLLADPGRVAADSFVTECRSRRLGIETAERAPFAVGEIRQKIIIYRITRGGR